MVDFIIVISKKKIVITMIPVLKSVFPCHHRLFSPRSVLLSSDILNKSDLFDKSRERGRNRSRGNKRKSGMKQKTEGGGKNDRSAGVFRGNFWPVGGCLGE